MNQEELLTRLGLALAIGFLIGVERGWRSREEAEGERAAGLRTFALTGLSGGLWALLAEEVGDVVFAAGFLAFAAAITLFRWRETEHEGRFGATTVVAAFLTFALGAYAIVGDMIAAAAGAVATAALLAAKEVLHTWLKALSWEELRAALILLAMSFVVLPVLPDEGYGPYEALNPYSLWLMTIVVAGVSFIGYVAVKVAGTRYGTLIAGVAGGLVSSTVTTLDLARKAKAAPANARMFLAGAIAASVTMFGRVGIVVVLFGPSLLERLAAPLAAAAVVLIAAALVLIAPWAKTEQMSEGEGAQLKNPFDLREALGFAALLAVILVLSKALTAMFGAEGSVGLAAVAGIADVDAITLSMTQLAGSGGSSALEAALAILVAVAANSLSKSALAIFAGGRWFGSLYLAISLAALVAGGVVALGEGWG
jgi:uncharacterized membrane protein (DUF4010 family)